MSLARTLALLVVAGLGAGHVESLLRSDPGPRGQELQLVRDRLQGRLASRVQRDPVAARATADPSQIVIAVRSRLIEDLAVRATRQYLRLVTLDLTAVEAHARGEIRKGTPIGRRKMGDWAVTVVIRSLVGQLQVGQPKVAFASNVLAVELPLEAQAASVPVDVRFSWNSSALANLVCKDFDVEVALDGRVARQQHVLKGQLQLEAGDDGLTATPLVPNRSFPLKVELTPGSWAKVQAALRTQDKLARCGLFLNPEDVVRSLHRLVAAGIRVRLPASMFRKVALPAGFQPTVKVNDRVVRLSLADQRLFSSESMLWASMRVSVADPLLQRAAQGGGRPPR